MSDITEQVRKLYEDYIAEFRRLEKNRKGGAGMFGLTSGPRNYPCHERFSSDLERLLREAEESGPTGEEAEQILDYIYFAPQTRQTNQDAVYWMMIAVHALTGGLITRLSPGAAAGLLERYRAAYPRRLQLPAQGKVEAALKRRAKQRSLP